MPQSSLLAWLNNKQTTASNLQRPENRSQTSQKVTLPTPPSSSDEHVKGAAAPQNGKDSQPSDPIQSSKSRTTLPPNVSFRACGKGDIPGLKRLNSLLLPIPYPESFYREIYEDGVTNNVTLLAFWHDSVQSQSLPENSGRLIGAIRCRILNPPPTSSAHDVKQGHESPMLYLSTLVLLSPYRGHGIATHMLQLMTKRAINDYGVGCVGAHVWEANVEGREWYAKRGLVETAKEAGYYRRLNPPGAVVLQRAVSVMDLLPD